MALFGKKVKACAICGNETKAGFLKGLFQKEIDGQYVCDECYGEVDVDANILNNMSIDAFRGYMAFREENQKLKDIFKSTVQIDLGALDTKFYFDMNHKLLSMDKSLAQTVFEAKHISSFEIREDDNTIIEGSASGMRCYQSGTYNYVMSLSSQIQNYLVQLRMFENRLNRTPEEKKDEVRKEKPRFDINEPFRNFYVIIYFDHPYRTKFQADMNGPVFDHNDPSVDKYLSTYNTRFATLEKLANTLMDFAFPGSEKQGASVSGAYMDSASVADEITRFKMLADQGIITRAEFETKKRQLLGM